MRKKKLEEINPRESDIYVECSLHINERGVSKWGYNLSLFGKYVYVDGEMNAEDIRLLALADKRLSSFDSSKLISAEDVNKKYGFNADDDTAEEVEFE